jgi:hypothetical protein
MASFTGGEKLQAKLKELADKIGDGGVRVGFLEDATYPDGQSVAAVAAFNNFGTSKAPPRPFFSNMVEEKQDGWGDALGKLCKEHDYDIPKVMGLMGEGIKGQLQESIVQFTDPQDSDETKARKQFKHADTSTLVDTGHMLNSVDYEVKE